jgi:hypothetical protein
MNNSAARSVFLAVAVMQEIIQRSVLSGYYFCDRVN